MKAAVFSCPGLGDGLVALILSHNLYLNGYQIDTFHKNLFEMQSWFKNLPIKSYPDIQTIPIILSNYDKLLISYDDSSDFIMELIKQGKEKCPYKTYVLNPCPSRKIGHQPYYKDAKFNPALSMVDNMHQFCSKVLKLSKIEKNNGIENPYELNHRKYHNFIALHPTSAKKSKNWSKRGYIKLAKALKKRGYTPVFIVSDNEKSNWLDLKEKNFVLESFANLNDLTSYIYEMGFLIGNDSGLGHLASCLNIPTISIFRNHRSAKLWRPGWAEGEIIYPNKFVPNISLFRLRDKHWQKFVSSKKVLKLTNKIISKY